MSKPRKYGQKNRPKYRLYLDEWMMVRITTQREVADACGMDASALSHLVANRFKRCPRASTLEKLRDALRLSSVQDLWRNPFESAPQDRAGPPMDLRKWLDTEDKLVRAGEPAPPWLVEMIRTFVERKT